MWKKILMPCMHKMIAFGFDIYSEASRVMESLVC